MATRTTRQREVGGPMMLVGFGLVLVWVFGYTHRHTTWLVWTDLAAAVVAFAVARPRLPRLVLVAAPYVLALGLLIAWGIALAADAEPALAWFTFAGAIAAGLVAAASAAPSLRRPRRARSLTQTGPSVGSKIHPAH